MDHCHDVDHWTNNTCNPVRIKADFLGRNEIRINVLKSEFGRMVINYIQPYILFLVDKTINIGIVSLNIV